ncbi:MAG: hypothetical protein IJV40_07140 [Oscillospiraceae bacterium]|nr:hypothetical protein [Oscillospiraceae bacterium]
MTTLNLKDEAARRGVPRIGEPRRCQELEPNHLYEIYMDEFDNEFIIRRGILTIVTGDGKVF